MKKGIIVLLMAILSFGSELNAQQYFSVQINQDSLIRYCNPDSMTTASILINDPYDEVDTFLIRYTINNVLQEDSLFFVDSLHWLDTVAVFVLDTTATMDTLSTDVFIVQDEDAPIISMYSESYHLLSLACDSTGQDKWALSGGYPFTYASVDAGIVSGIGSNHLITSDMPPGTRILTYSVYGCQQPPFSFVVQALPVPQIKIEQVYLATSCALPKTGKVLVTSNDTVIFDSLSVNYDVYTDILNDSVYVHLDGGYNDLVVYMGACLWTQTFFVEREQENILTIGDVIQPHESVSTGSVAVLSEKEIGDAKYVLEGLETFVLFSPFEVNYQFLQAGDYQFEIQDKRGCWSHIDYTLASLQGVPIPYGFSADSLFTFAIDGVPLYQVPEIGDGYVLKIYKIFEHGPAQQVFNTEKGSLLPWDKSLNGKSIYGYFLYELMITNPLYTGENPFRSYFRIIN
jgi:hypothetical protein